MRVEQTQVARGGAWPAGSALAVAVLVATSALAQTSAPAVVSQAPAPPVAAQASVPAVAGQPPAPAAAAQAPAAGGDANDLSRQATDPTASLMSFNFINDYRTSFYPQWNLKDITGANKAKIIFTITVLAPAK